MDLRHKIPKASLLKLTNQSTAVGRGSEVGFEKESNDTLYTYCNDGIILTSKLRGTALICSVRFFI